MSSIVVFGGYGVFGSHVARELARMGHRVVIAGRDHAKAEAFAESLGQVHSAAAVDVADAARCRSVIEGHDVAVHCAGPFRKPDATLLEACLAAGSHYVDITDDRDYARLVRFFSGRFVRQGLAAVYGCSSLPGISGALGQAIAESEGKPERARVTLFIGNKNPKGIASVRSLLSGLGRPIATPQGAIHGFCRGEIVSLPPPWGRQTVFNFESPDYDLFPKLLGAKAVVVKVGFELRLVTFGLAAVAQLGVKATEALSRGLEWAAGRVNGIGTSGGAVMTELFYPDKAVCRATLTARTDGQRMAAIPAALVAHSLATGSAFRGAGAAYEALGAQALLSDLVAAGFELSMRRAGTVQQ
jgi:hypothetical protein